MLVKLGKTNITQLTKQELQTLHNQVQFKCAQGHAFTGVWIGTRDCQSHRAGTHCQQKSNPWFYCKTCWNNKSSVYDYCVTCGVWG